MSLRPVQAHWFELLTPREDLTSVLECLADTHAVELQAHSEIPSPLKLPGMELALEEYAELSRKYATYWPVPMLRVSAHKTQSPKQIFDNATQKLRQWCTEADPYIQQLQSLERDRADLMLLNSLISSGADALPDVELMAKAGPVLGSIIFLMPEDSWPDVVPTLVITQRIVHGRRTFLVAVGPVAELATLSDSARALKGREILLPDWLPRETEKARQIMEGRIAGIDKRMDELGTELDRLAADSDLAGVLGDMRLMQWFAEHVPEIPASERFAWVTGWSSETEGDKLETSLDLAGVRHLLRFGEPPAGFKPPMILTNPSWIRPFELFARLLGTPGSGEADPTPIVAVFAPVMFGFMFGDVGQGAVILLAGLMLRKQYPALNILVAGGLMSIVFGVLFGSVFAREDLIPALWIRPFEQPLTMLVVSLLLGAIVLFIGLGLSALQAHWTGHGSRWWKTSAGHLLAYAGLVCALLEPALLWLTLAGVGWFLLGHAFGGDESRGIGAAVAESLETMFQLIINTVSFVRVGAFALAHSGLSTALIAIADGAASTWATVLILVVGNAFVIVLEGLVVGIQTTRLVLFEFFVRFLTATGRQFQPLPAPAIVSDKPHKESS